MAFFIPGWVFFNQGRKHFCARLKTLLAIFLSVYGADSRVQQDTLRSIKLESVVVTATRNERSLDGIPMPVQIIEAAAIKTMGSVRLQDALAEQTGLVVVPQINAQGNGLQLQGFNPDYTLILIDGEPLIGRYTGSLELSRVTTGNIRRIEIVKGPSSSLYGSEALAGVINILTEQPSNSGGNVSFRYGSNRTSDLSGNVSSVSEKVRFSVFGNRYETAGYDLSPQNFGKTVSPFSNFTLQPKLSWKISPAINLNLSSRFFDETQRFGFEVLSGSTTTRTSGNGITRDLSFNPSLNIRVSDKAKVTARLYATTFKTETELKLESGGDIFYKDDFRQSFIRPEAVVVFAPNLKHTLTYGTGAILEQVNTSRYGDRNTRAQSTYYAFAQDEWTADEKINLISGIRMDLNNIYGSQVSPKLSASYKLTEQLFFKVSGGIGFKAPDFRQLYFNFTNSAAGGYAVLGTEVIREKLKELENLGQIETYLFNPDNLEQIKAERSVSVNAGLEWKKDRLSISANAFHNEINNLIENQAVATTVSGQGIYTYRNILTAFTRGIESGFQYNLSPAWSISGGHQLLFAMDRAVFSDVKNGKYFYRDPETLITGRLNAGEYFGLQNRSRHSGNLKLFFHNRKKWEGSVRLIWRSKFGVGDIRGNIQGETIPPSDINSNGILDKYDRFVGGYLLSNISIARELHSGLRIQAGVDNLFNHREPIYIPNMPGRIIYLSAGWKFNFNSTNPN